MLVKVLVSLVKFDSLENTLPFERQFAWVEVLKYQQLNNSPITDTRVKMFYCIPVVMKILKL